MITILHGKTPGSTYMAGVVDNIRKEVSGCNFEEVDIQKGQQG